MKHFIVGSLFILIATLTKAAIVDTIQIQSSSLKKTTKVVVVVPAVSKSSQQKFPVVYLLHGYSGNYGTWLREAPQLMAKADELGLILVTVDGGFGSWYFDSPLDSTIRYESVIIQEIIPYIDTHYPTIANRSARAITGLSMGGHGGLYLSSRHTDVFGAAGSICGGVDFRPFPNNWDIKKSLGLLSEHPDLWNEHVVVTQVERLKNKELALIIDCGLDDFFLQVNRNLHEKLMQLKIDHDYTERPGAHNRAYWSNSIDYQLLFFKKFFNGKA